MEDHQLAPAYRRRKARTRRTKWRTVKDIGIVFLGTIAAALALVTLLAAIFFAVTETQERRLTKSAAGQAAVAAAGGAARLATKLETLEVN